MKPVWRRSLGLLAVLAVFSAMIIVDRLIDPFHAFTLPVSDWSAGFVNWLTDYARPLFQLARQPINVVLDLLLGTLNAAPPSVVIAAVFLIAWQLGGIRLAIYSAAGLVLLGLMGIWSDTMITVAIIVSSVFFCLLIGIPLGIASAKSDRLAMILRPMLDIMQTCPAFVYLVPIVMLVGIGNVPGVAVTVIFALPPVVRLTDLGIRQVPASYIEAARALGVSDREILFGVELPLASRSIMAGVNQTLMMALSMVVVASMISVEGLGLLVLRGIGRLDMGLATVGGIGIVVLAMLLDRITQAAAKPESTSMRWTQRGPLGIAADLLRALQQGREGQSGHGISAR